MGRAIVHTIDISRPPRVVYAYATDPARFPDWQDDVVDVRVDGSRFTTTRRIAGRPRDMVQEVTAADGRHWAARAVAGAVRPSAALTVEPLAGGASSRVTFTLDFETSGAAGILAPQLRRMAARAAPRSYRRLKELLEAAPPAPPPAPPSAPQP
jgi:uncharacterized protein YndB with AHSA1/START domain